MVVGIASAGLHNVNILACSIEKVKSQKIIGLDYARIWCDRFIWVENVRDDISRNIFSFCIIFLYPVVRVYMFWGVFLQQNQWNTSPKNLVWKDMREKMSIFLKGASFKSFRCWALLSIFELLSAYPSQSLGSPRHSPLNKSFKIILEKTHP